MKWRYYYLGENNDRAKKHIMENVSHCAYGHTLTKKLLVRSFAATGPIIVIAMEGLELDRVADYSNAAYYLGSGLHEALGGQQISLGNRPIDGLTSFLTEYLRTSEDGLVLIENWIATRTAPHMTPESRAEYQHGSRVAFFHDEVYHILTAEVTDPEVIEDTIREPWHHWFTGVCAAGLLIPENYELTKEFLDRLVLNTEHIFVPALDGEGFLVWSPTLRGPEKVRPEKVPGTNY